ncbi:methyl-accepting chemotaxis protein [Chelatococcus sp. SYSU_G07232]|uniref:Methyl-accepting chemotaxis protein n=1 Tax=Chelatococcus albus TaxID=3047466 RepID=A0ABT7AIL2_9HYPH|nr:methyl-accepting chemotaxis protein [Chelatococcus sp. SYSU_G07232]MDJ1158634.1 methyl-accepting chemotaxis protein [Chelatococcus sp. SYSU_G07232]
MRVRGLFILCMSVAGALAALVSSFVAWQEWQRWSAAAEARALVETLGQVARFNERLALERGNYNQLLVTEAPAAGQPLETALASRRNTDAVADRLKELVAALPGDARKRIERPVSASLAALAQTRAAVDRGIARAMGEREPGAAAQYQRAVMDIIATGSRLLGVIEAEIGARDAETANTTPIVGLAMDLRDVGGSRSAWFSQYVGSGQRFSPELVVQIHEMTGRITQAWDRLQRVVGQAERGSRLEAAMRAMKAAFIDEGGRNYAAVFAAGRDGAAPPMGLAEWRNWTSASLQTIIGVRDAALEDALQTADATIASARLRVVFAVALLGVIVALIGGCAAMFSRRVVEPLAALTQAIERIAEGRYETPVPGAERTDEIGAIAGAIRVFKDNALRMRELEAEERAAAAERVARAEAMAAVVGEVGKVVAAAADGDFSARVSVTDAEADLRKLVEGINAINAVVDRATVEFAAVLGAVARGDLTQAVATDYRGRFGELKAAVNETIHRLAETVVTIQTTAAEVTTAAKEINSGADDLSRRTEDQASSLEETAATTEELAASVKASAHSSRDAVALAQEAMQVAEAGGSIVQDVVDAMTRIERASAKISEITSVIDEIAFQTNLLALNAAVEAARAGEQGKGFAVVASEVRTLAQRSGDAAKDITGLIASSAAEVEQGVKLVRSAGEALVRIVGASQKVSETVTEISTAAQEQANGIDEMSQAVAHMDEMTQQNAALAEQSAAAAAMLASQIQRLNDLVATFRTRREAGTAARQAGEPRRQAA